MKLLFFIFYSVIILVANTKGQNNGYSSNKFTGLYFGGELTNVGYYYFNPDSSFYFFKTGFIPDKKTKEFKDRFNDTLVGYGKGRWFIEDDFFIINFDKMPDENIIQGDIQYQASSKKPYDSLFLKIFVTNSDEMTLNIASIKLFNRYIGNPLGGYSVVTLPLHYSQHKLEIYKSGYLKRDIQLIPGYNFHEITTTLAKDDFSTIELASESRFPYKFHYKNGMLKVIGKMKKQSEGKEKLLLFIKNSIIKFPQQIAFLQKIMRELN